MRGSSCPSIGRAEAFSLRAKNALKVYFGEDISDERQEERQETCRVFCQVLDEQFVQWQVVRLYERLDVR